MPRHCITGLGCAALWLSVAAVLTSDFAGAAPPRAPSAVEPDAPPDAPEFTTDVLPILEKKCNRCHGEKRRGGKLDMRTREALLVGGVSGPAIKPGDAKKSLLIELIHYNEMPPKKEEPRVTKQELELLKRWVDTGANESEDGAAPP